MYIYESQRDNTGGVLYNITTIGIIFSLSVYAQLFMKKTCPSDLFFLCKMVYKT